MSNGDDYEDTKVAVGQRMEGRGNGNSVLPIAIVGSGTFGTCWLVWNARWKALQVAKIAKQEETCNYNMKTEAANFDRIWKKNDVDHRLHHIVMYHGHFKLNKCTQVILMEPVGYSLVEVISAREDGLPIEWVKKITRQVLLALQYLHGHRIVHADIKPENVMVLLPTEHYYRIAVDSLEESLTNGIDVDPALIKDIRSGPYWKLAKNKAPLSAKDVATGPDFHYPVKIGDFGSAEWKVSPRVKKIVSTREYRAPEVMLGTPLTTALDIWSVGTMTYELSTTGYLFDPHLNLEKGSEEELDQEHLKQIMACLSIPENYKGDRFPVFRFNTEEYCKVKPDFFKDKRTTLYRMLKDHRFERNVVRELGAFLSKALDVDSKKRSTASDLLADDFLRERMDGTEDHRIPNNEERNEGNLREEVIEEEMSDREQEFVEEPKQEVYDAEVELAPSVLLPVGYIPRLPARTTSRIVHEKVVRVPSPPRDRQAVETPRQAVVGNLASANASAPSSGRVLRKRVAIERSILDRTVASRIRPRENIRGLSAEHEGTPVNNGAIVTDGTRRITRAAALRQSALGETTPVTTAVKKRYE